MTARTRRAALLLPLALALTAGRLAAETDADAGTATPIAVAAADDERLAWFRDARLGIFIHWGIYAVEGIDESWSFYNGYLSYEDYMAQLEGFTAERYDPEAWAELIDAAGARYAVLTTKHHDGVALWDTEANDLDVVEATPAGRDLVGPFVQALRARDLKVGLYYSHLDWSHPDYPLHTKSSRRYRIDDDPARWQRFLDFRREQVEELVTTYRPDLLWFDGDWDFGADHWASGALREAILGWQPDIILNSRLNGHGDYATPEQGLPIAPPEGPWELCLTMNDSWGYQENDHNYKSAYQIVRIFADVLAGGGNLLLDIGPRADGTIPGEQRALLEALGRWTDDHAEAIYGTRAGIPAGHFYGPTTLSADRQTLYLFLPHPPGDEPVVVKGLKNPINRIRIVGNGTKLQHQILGKQYWSPVPGILYIDVPEPETDPLMTVIALQLKGEIDLHRE